MRILFMLLIGFGLNASAFMIPDSIITDWKNPGSEVYSLPGTNVVSILDFDGKNDSSANTNTPLKRAITALGANGGTIFFPAGTYRFDSTIVISQDKIILLGAGAQATRFAFGLGNRDNHCIQSTGSVTGTTATINNTVLKGERSFQVSSADAFSVGDWVFVRQGDSTYFTSDWAFGKFIQEARIDSIIGNRIVLNKPVRHTFFQSLNPYIQKVNPRKNIGIECIKLSRLDEPAAGQASVVFLSYVVNCWVKGVESDKCQFGHVTVEFSSNVSVLNSYFHHAFNYGGGGRGYGVVLQFGASNNLVQNNVFKHLRHAVLLQASPNGNVVGYNYMFEPYWDEFPSNSAGQIVLHGNYPFSNLFEGNICENLVIDNSHGLNGPYNTFLRNRFTGFGIFMATGIASRTSFVGNEITGTLYTITGTNNYLYGNNNKGSISPSNISSLPDTSYYLTALPPSFWTLAGTLPTIGYPKSYNTGNIPARSRYTASPSSPYLCDNSIPTGLPRNTMTGISIYPNPTSGNLFIIQNLNRQFGYSLYNAAGQVLLSGRITQASTELNLRAIAPGVYFLQLIDLNNGEISTIKLLRD